MGDFFAELRRRRIYRIGAVYVVVAWGITQVLDVLSQLFALPAWIAQPAVIVLAIGLPVSLMLAWMIVGAASDPDGSADRLKATNTDWILASALVIVICLIGYQQFAPRTAEITQTAEQTGAAANIADEMIEEIAERLPNSVAVLPFENRSLDPENAFFASGIHDEILNQLSKLSNVNVIARTSVMQYAEGEKTIPEIADELNVGMVMEGSVRYAGDQIRVTAQLIDGNTNGPIWTDEFDGNLSDIFGIQAEIAMNIANSLRAAFSVQEQENIERPPTDSPEAYAAYLRALAEASGGGGIWGGSARRERTHSYLDEALELDPNFASAHAWKAYLYSIAIQLDPVTDENFLDHWAEMTQLARTHANRALALDPTVGLAHFALAVVERDGGLSVQEYQQALRLSPNDLEVLGAQAYMEAHVFGRIDEAIRIHRRLIELDPNNVLRQQGLAYALHLAGRYAEAIEILRVYMELLLLPRGRGFALDIARSEIALGNKNAALVAVRDAEEMLSADTTLFARDYPIFVYAYGLLGEAEDARRLFDRFIELSAAEHVFPNSWVYAYMGIGDYDEAFRRLNDAAEHPELRVLWLIDGIRLNTWLDPMLEQPEFVEVREKLAWAPVQ